MAKVALLISRQPLQPSGRTPWVRAVIEAVRWVRKNGHTLVSSVGMPTWELVTVSAALAHVPLQLVLPPLGDAGADTNAFISGFGLDPAMTTVHVLESKDPKQPKADRLLRRDEVIVSEADILVPIAVKPHGNMAALLAAHRQRKTCVDRFRVTAKTRLAPVGYRIPADTINPRLAELAGPFLFHWTRACHGPWPDESPFTYYRDIINSPSYPRSAFETLRRIVSHRRLIASPWRMPGNIPTVSFSACPPASMAPLMRWRARYRRMSFEPYAIGIRRTVAEDVGIRPVCYYRGDNPLAGSDDIWLSQSAGRQTDWRHEHEYRHRGDLNLSAISDTDLVLITRTRSEATALSQVTGLRVYPFTTEDV
ncbi:MAG: hypothetical protein D6800_09230 [Candidatus Zixiibacteriota bacterium]|nr:MAG: hypothetical protein D6800_09230 [candidate division Zixibacteria bacterium]